MQILISCSKDMAQKHNEHLPSLTPAYFQAQAEQIVRHMNTLSSEELSKQLKLNSQLAALNKLRYHNFFDATPCTATVLAYTGMVYRHLAPETWERDDFFEAQQHLWTTSFLYGLLRPLDGIKAYRLEGKVRLPLPEETTIFAFWRQHLTDAFIQSILSDDGVLLYLASSEMKQLFDWKQVSKACRVITVHFLVKTPTAQLKNIVVYTKMMRGAMARHLITKRLRQAEQIQNFSYEGFTFQPDLSTDKDWVWVME